MNNGSFASNCCYYCTLSSNIHSLTPFPYMSVHKILLQKKVFPLKLATTPRTHQSNVVCLRMVLYCIVISKAI